MSSRFHFAKKRRDQDRALKAAVAQMEQIAKEHGIDVPSVRKGLARKSEERHRLTVRLLESVVPLFLRQPGMAPARVGSCVLVRLDSQFFAFTAAHVVADFGTAMVLAPSHGNGGTLLPLPPYAARLFRSRGANDLDIGVLALEHDQLGSFKQHVFLEGADIDQIDRPDDHGIGSFYFILGYSASRTQVKVSPRQRHIHQQSFSLVTEPVGAAEYQGEGMSAANHLLLNFDHEGTVVGGLKSTPPKLQGVSGGGIFHIDRGTYRGPLVAIATRNPRDVRLIVGTRIKHFLALARTVHN
jgi:hypothetical protein